MSLDSYSRPKILAFCLKNRGVSHTEVAVKFQMSGISAGAILSGMYMHGLTRFNHQKRKHFITSKGRNLLKRKWKGNYPPP
jgi:predicted transcriptional regulator